MLPCLSPWYSLRERGTFLSRLHTGSGLFAFGSVAWGAKTASPESPFKMQNSGPVLKLRIKIWTLERSPGALYTHSYFISCPAPPSPGYFPLIVYFRCNSSLQYFSFSFVFLNAHRLFYSILSSKSFSSYHFSLKLHFPRFLAYSYPVVLVLTPFPHDSWHFPSTCTLESDQWSSVL